jgi:hypothetical protein
MDVALDGVTAANFAETVEDRFREAAYMEFDYQFHLTLYDLMGNVPSRLYSKMFAARGEQRVRYMLLTLLDASSNMQVSMGQDRLYAIMHLAKDYEEGSIIVDYNKTEEQVMVDAAAYHISQHRNLEFLYESMQNDIQRAANFESNETIGPTWIPNEWMGRKNQGWSILEVDRYRPMIMKSPGLMTTKCSPHSVDIRNLRLHVRGVKVGWLRQCLVFNQDVEE